MRIWLAACTLMPMPNDKDPIELQDEVLELRATIAPSQVEALRLSISFWEKLVILDGAALTLSVTSATAFRGHTVGDGGVGYLFAAWKLLLLSIIFAAIAQGLGANSAQHLPLAAAGKLIADRRMRLRLMGLDIFDETPERMKTLSKKSFMVDAILWGTAESTGLIALFFMIVALVYLYRFGVVNLPTFLSK